MLQLYTACAGVPPQYLLPMYLGAGTNNEQYLLHDPLLKQGLLCPLQSNILETEIQTATRVAKLVFDSGLARVKQPTDMVAFIRQHVYKPEYQEQAAQASAAGS